MSGALLVLASPPLTFLEVSEFAVVPGHGRQLRPDLAP